MGFRERHGRRRKVLQDHEEGVDLGSLFVRHFQEPAPDYVDLEGVRVERCRVEPKVHLAEPTAFVILRRIGEAARANLRQRALEKWVLRVQAA